MSSFRTKTMTVLFPLPESLSTFNTSLDPVDYISEWTPLLFNLGLTCVQSMEGTKKMKVRPRFLFLQLSPYQLTVNLLCSCAKGQMLSGSPILKLLIRGLVNYSLSLPIKTNLSNKKVPTVTSSRVLHHPPWFSWPYAHIFMNNIFIKLYSFNFCAISYQGPN